MLADHIESEAFQELVEHIDVINCNALAENLLRANGGKGKNIEMNPPKGTDLVVPEFGETAAYKYHQVYVYDGLVFDPRFSRRPIQLEIYLEKHPRCKPRWLYDYQLDGRVTVSRVIAALERLGEIEWYVIRPSEIATGSQTAPLFPPLVTFRFRVGNQAAFERLEEYLRKYSGSVKWVVSGKGEKNLCLLPERVWESALGRKSMMDAINLIIQNDPSFVRLAVQDFTQLVSYLETIQ